jgi:hypothetical protein
VFFSLFIIKIPKSSKRWSIERKDSEKEREKQSIEKKEEGKRKAPQVSAYKKGKSIF